MKIQLTDQEPGEYDEYFLAPDKLLEGNPKQSVWMKYTDSTNRFFVGTWSSEVGKWKISYTEEEYCELLEGRSVIADAAGNSVTVSTGDAFVIPRGFVGTWEVVLPTRKKFVIYEAGN
jgi:uncharacterized cupin superfamily protein